jgi:hypothetical protein
MINRTVLKSAITPAIVALALAGFALSALAQDVNMDPADVTLGKAEYSPYLGQGYPDRVYFGDTHLHTSYSTDAGMVGCRLGPEEAYRFALGQEVTSSTGVRARLQRPLDFLVVADHAENLGLTPMIEESNPELLKTEWGQKVHDLVHSGEGGEAYNVWGAAMTERAPFGNALPPPQRNTTSPASSPPSSASSGPRARRATTCTATSSSATARPKPTVSCPSRSTTRSIRRNSGSG